jgi:hypothetical protein
MMPYFVLSLYRVGLSEKEELLKYFSRKYSGIPLLQTYEIATGKQRKFSIPEHV